MSCHSRPIATSRLNLFHHLRKLILCQNVKVENIKFFIVESTVELVLSGNTCGKLDLLEIVYQLVSHEVPLRKVELHDYPELFTGLECLPGIYHIELYEGAIPVFYPPRKVSITQRE